MLSALSTVCCPRTAVFIYELLNDTAVYLIWLFRRPSVLAHSERSADTTAKPFMPKKTTKYGDRNFRVNDPLCESSCRLIHVHRILRCVGNLGNCHIKLILCHWKVAKYSTSSSAMAERPRDESAILSAWVTLRLNFRLKGYVSSHYELAVRWGNSYTTTLPLEIFTQRNFVADFIPLKLNFIKNKNKNRFLSHPLGDLG